MAKILKNIFTPSVDEIAQTYTIESWHVSQSVDAFTGVAAYDIFLSGSMNITGSLTNGQNTNVASGLNSHAEGRGTTASGQAAHSEGQSTEASGQASHAEGTGTLASGQFSHAEGTDTVASGISAHSEGIGTIAAGNYQTTVGSYNISKNDPTAFIIGKGTSDGSRSNLLFASGSRFEISGAVFLPTITTLAQSNVLTIDTTTGQLYYTASSAFGGGGGSTDTGSLLTTASISTNILTFTKGDGSTFPITIASSSYAVSSSYSVSSSYAFNSTSASYTLSASVAISSSYALSSSYAFNSTSASYAFNSTSASYALTASYVPTAILTASSAANNITFTKFDGSTFSVGVTAAANAGGDNTQIQFNSASILSGSSDFIFDYTLSSLSQGNGNIATGQYSHAEGYITLASGNSSHAEGYETTASGDYSHAEGQGAWAKGDYSHAGGYYSVASGSWSTVFGQFNTASAGHSFAAGFSNNITSGGTYSTVLGQNSYSNATAAFVSGLYAVANGNYQTVVGRGNKLNITTAEQDLFVVGNGVSPWGLFDLSNAFRVSQSGECFSGTTFTNGGADYAEFFESLDGTSFPYGTVVELSGDKIIPCTNAENAIGVISARPSVLGNSDDGTGDTWNGQWLKDVWGNYIMEPYEYEEISGLNEDGTPQYTTKSGIKRSINPAFNPDLTYIPRNQRPEWNKVGLLGQIKVLKNQPIPSRWIKLKDINDEVAIYLVK